MSLLTEAEANIMDRLRFADRHRAEGSAGWVGVTAPDRMEALLSVARKGLARTWWGEGKDAGVLLGQITQAGRIRK